VPSSVRRSRSIWASSVWRCASVVCVTASG
jgi:hypothetical protein